MFWRPTAPALILVLLTIPVHSPLASATFDLLTTRPPESLRGEEIDVDDAWNGARLLAHFGESKRAVDLLRRRPANEALDPLVERFQARLLTEIGLAARADSVLALQSYTGDRQQYYLLCMQRARLNLIRGEHERALGFLALIDTLSFPVFEPYRDYLALMTYLARARFEEACAVGERRLAGGIPVSLSPRFEEHLFDAYLQAEKYEKARKFLGMIKARPSDASKMAPLLIREVELLFVLGDTLGALETALALTKNRGTGHLALDVVKATISRVAASKMSGEALLEFTDVLLRNRLLGEADLLMSVLAKQPLDKDETARRTVLMADLYYQEKRYTKAFNLIRKKFSDAALERRAMLMRARIYRKTGQAEQAAAEYTDFARLYPYDSKAAEALLVASDMYLRIGDRTNAMDVLHRITDTYPSHYYARIATMRMAAYYLDRKHYSRAIEILEESLERSGRKNEELIFHLAEAYGRMGKEERKGELLSELATLNPISFYRLPDIKPTSWRPVIASDGRIALDGDTGLLEFLKRAFRQREEAYRQIRDVLPSLADGQDALEASGVYLQRGRQFLLMGFRDWGEDELRVLESNRRLPARVSFELGVLYDDFAMHWKSVRAFQRVYYALSRQRRDELESHFRHLMYPMPYPAQVFENCARYDIPPHLIYGMIRRESMFEVNAVSSAGAMGLMQLMPQTGEQVASELGFPEEVRENLFVPEINLTFGTWYASHLLGRSGGNTAMMLAAYNGGFGNARRWFGKGGRNSEVITKVDGIDYRETREYVKHVIEAAHIYHAYYFDGSAGDGAFR